MTDQTIKCEDAPKTYTHGDYFLDSRGNLLRLCQVAASKVALMSEDGNRCLDATTVGHAKQVTHEELSRMTERTLTPVKSVTITYTL